MKTKLKLQIEEAIDKVIQDGAEDDLWEGWITPELHLRMADAAATVFDASIEGQKFAEKQVDK